MQDFPVGQVGSNSPAHHLMGDDKCSTGKAGTIKTMDCLVNNHLQTKEMGTNVPSEGMKNGF